MPDRSSAPARRLLTGLFALGLIAAVAPPAAAGPTPAAEQAIVLEGELERSEVKRVIERGPQKFIASLRVAPYMKGKRFMGFRIEGFAADSPLVNSRAVQPGDVVLKVNGEPVERPEQFMRAWEVVAGAEALEVTLLRGTQRYVYRWTLR